MPMMTSAKAVISFGSAAIVAQIAPLTGVAAVDTATRWTLDGALVVAVGCLVKAVVALFKINAIDRAEATAAAKLKDEQILSMAKQITEAMVLTKEAVSANTSKIADLQWSAQHPDSKRRP